MAIEELKNWNDDLQFKGKARGGDYPQASISKPFNNPKPCAILTTKTGLKDIDDRALYFPNFKIQFDMYSQSPAINVSHNGWEFKIDTSRMKRKPAANGDGYKVLDATELDADKVGVLDLSKHLESDLQHLAMKDADLQALSAFGTIKQTPELSGLVFLTFNAKRKMRARWVGSGPEKKDPEVERFLESFNSKNPPLVTIARKTQVYWPELDGNWLHRVRIVANRGLMPYFTDDVNLIVGDRFKKYRDDPNMRLRHMPWMARPGQTDKEAITEYASHVARKSFGTMEEWELTIGAALCFEVEFENNCIDKYFNATTEHKMKIISVRGTYAQAEVSLKPVKDIAAPPIVGGTQFVMQLGTTVVPKENDENAAPETAKENDGNAAPETAKENDKPAETTNTDDANKPEASTAPVDPAAPAPEKMQLDASLDSLVKNKPATQKDAKLKRKAAKKAQLAEQEGQAGGSGAAEGAGALNPAETGAPASAGEDVPMAGTENAEAPVDKGKEKEKTPKPEKEEEKKEKENGEEPKWRCRASERETSKSFVMSFTFEKFDKDVFQVGQEMMVNLHMKRNDLPSKRMLTAIIYLSQADTDNPVAAYLSGFLLGDELPDGKGKEMPMKAAKDLEPIMKKIFDKFVKGMGLNGPQQAAWNSIFNTTNCVNMVQGPPGTGKTKLDVAIAITFALLGFRVAMCAPSNKATEALMVGLIKQVEPLLKEFPDLKKHFNILYFPSTAIFKEQLEVSEEDVAGETIAGDAEAAAKSDVKPFMLWTQVIEHFKSRSEYEELKAEEREEATQWLQTLRNIRAGLPMNGKQFKKFHKLGNKAVKEIVNGKSVKIIVSTSNNSAQLFDFGFKPDALILDECAFATEQDTAVPLALKVSYLVLSGDHAQLQPIFGSTGKQEYWHQVGLSLFERALRNGNVPLFRLKINYRMHPEIALLPGMLSYGWLGCDESTSAEKDTYIFLREYYHKHKRYQDIRHRALYNKEKKWTSIRRLFFHVKDARSAALEGDTSLVNYATAWAIVEEVTQMFMYEAPPERKLPHLGPSNMLIATGYAAQKLLIEKLLKLIWEYKAWDMSTIPHVVTIDSVQGRECEFMLLDLTAANEHRGAMIGFLNSWNRMNVALTRAQEVLWIYGNIECWRSELQTIVEYQKGKKFAYFLIDLLDKGDIVPLEGRNTIPKDLAELESGREKNWTLEMPHADPEESKLRGKANYCSITYKNSYKQKVPERRQKVVQYEQKLLALLEAFRAKARAMEAQFQATGDVETALFNDDDDAGEEEGAGGGAGNDSDDELEGPGRRVTNAGNSKETDEQPLEGEEELLAQLNSLDPDREDTGSQMDLGDNSLDPDREETGSQMDLGEPPKNGKTGEISTTFSPRPTANIDDQEPDDNQSGPAPKQTKGKGKATKAPKANKGKGKATGKGSLE